MDKDPMEAPVGIHQLGCAGKADDAHVLVGAERGAGFTVIPTIPVEGIKVNG